MLFGKQVQKPKVKRVRTVYRRSAIAKCVCEVCVQVAFAKCVCKVCVQSVFAMCVGEVDKSIREGSL